MKRAVLCLGIVLSMTTALYAAAHNPNTKLLAYTAAADALGKIDDPAARPFLTEALGSNDFFIRAYAARALGNMGDTRAIAPLQKLLADRNYLVKVYATVALVKLGDTGAQKAFLALLNDSDYVVRAAAVTQIGNMGKKYEPLIAKIILEEHNPIVRAKAMEQVKKLELTTQGESGAEDITGNTLTQALNDSNWEVRQAACIGLGKLEVKPAIPFLIERLGDKNDFVRAAAKESLALLGETSLTKFFRQDLNAPNPILRVSSFIALARVHDVEVVPILIKTVLDPGVPTLVRIQAARALTLIKPYVERLVNNGLTLTHLKTTLSTDTNLAFSYQAGGKTLQTIFIEALRNPASPLHPDAAFVLKEFGDPVSLPALRETLIEGEPDAAISSMYVLGELHDKNASDQIIRACKRF